MAALNANLQAKLDAYLLGRLSHGEQTQIETLMFEDDDVFEALRDAEDDLIDRYLAGELAAADRVAFEHTFASSRQERIAFARALALDLASRAPAQATRPPAGVASARGGRTGRAFAMKRLLTGGAAAAAAVAIAVVWWMGLAPGNGRAGPASPSAGTGASSTPVNGGTSPASGETGQVPPDGPAIATFVLRPMELRRSAGHLPRVRVPEGTTAIRFQPEIETPIASGSYAVTLRRVEGELVWQGTASVERGRLSVTVPARLVVPGDYLLRFAPPGVSPDDSAEYPFRVSSRD